MTKASQSALILGLSIAKRDGSLELPEPPLPQLGDILFERKPTWRGRLPRVERPD